MRGELQIVYNIRILAQKLFFDKCTFQRGLRAVMRSRDLERGCETVRAGRAEPSRVPVE